LELGGLFALHVSQAGARGYGRSGIAGFFVAAVGWAAILLSAEASLLSGQSALVLLLVAGTPVFTVGVLLLAAATYRARVLPRWGAALVVVLLLTAYGPWGGLLGGLAWLALGCLLFLSGRAAPRRRA
jgi:hypothetical protein